MTTISKNMKKSKIVKKELQWSDFVESQIFIVDFIFS